MTQIGQLQTLAKAVVATALMAGGTIATASPAQAVSFLFSGTVTQVETSNAFVATPTGSAFISNVQVGTPFTGKLTYSPPNSRDVTYDGSGYNDITPSSGVKITLGGYTFTSLPYPSTSAFAPIIRYILAVPLNTASIESFLSVGIGEQSGQLTPESAALVGPARESYSYIEADLINTLLSIGSADFGYGSDFVIVSNINSFYQIPEPSSTLGTIVLGIVGSALILKRKKTYRLQNVSHR
ncbi:PEP-CTERM sorting domain-containing protein [Anabaena sp. CCY 9402-a]|uniref:PEP-CTERM sorting domain-containing protein n=1 Tax=Anabaena sp. CCY 9402-a TaxID=3103867 RepID=UPI0039C60F9A